MTRPMPSVCVSGLALMLCMLAAPSAAQLPQRPQPTPAVQPVPEPAGEAVPLKVTIVVSRSKGDTQVSSLPFELFVNANTRATATINLGVDVPVPAGGPNSFTYRRVGSNISCSSARYVNGAITLELQIEESSIHTDPVVPGGVPAQAAPPPPPPPAGQPVPYGSAPAGPIFRSFTTQTIVSMVEGQNLQYTLATDKQTGETLRVSVMATRVR